jgi:hypothetical protein
LKLAVILGNIERYKVFGKKRCDTKLQKAFRRIRKIINKKIQKKGHVTSFAAIRKLVLVILV